MSSPDPILETTASMSGGVLNKVQSKAVLDLRGASSLSGICFTCRLRTVSELYRLQGSQLLGTSGDN